MEKLTKKALNKFIVWSTSRYNSYLGFGSKKVNVDIVYNSLLNGYYTDGQRTDTGKVIFQIECSGGNGEGYGRYWRLKGRKGDYKYEINCAEMSITGLQTQTKIQFKK